MPIVPVILTWVTADNTKRQQLPLKLTWGITIYKAHRLLIPKVVIYIYWPKGASCRFGLCCHFQGFKDFRSGYRTYNFRQELQKQQLQNQKF